MRLPLFKNYARAGCVSFCTYRVTDDADAIDRQHHDTIASATRIHRRRATVRELLTTRSFSDNSPSPLLLSFFLLSSFFMCMCVRVIGSVYSPTRVRRTPRFLIEINSVPVVGDVADIVVIASESEVA